ncbi:hypothetical protein Clacol_005699 [Clathrus columnatus]|uniref:Xylanolytic transcriptional activator regulatory domain-containing protein n=1 Tax=Clathrus columnatus TaxID=1419009 RepID=A0AAV5AG51_9AGAM|nr:hypothetical protein Clacol_005699 [Clathrus columnatus]
MASRLDSWQQGGNRSRRKACGECESCQKRGCAAICPDGSFMKGTRSLKTSALKLHEKMAQMSARIHDLEEALARIQASVSAEPHPLLQPADDDDERSRSPIPVAALIETNIPPTETPDDLAEALGTLTIRPFGESQFHGDTASSEVSFCISLPVSQDELYDILSNEIYIEGQHPLALSKINLHRLAVVLMVFAMGCLFDMERPLCSTEAEDFHSLARAALCGEQIFNSTSIECVQAMSLMVWYMRMCPGNRSTGYLWSFSGLLSKLVQAIGLHREPTTKSFPPAEILRRQTTFWEYIRQVTGDVWQSFVFGRPSSMVFSQIDCKKPREVPGYVGAPQGLFYRWKYGFTNLVGDVLSLTTGATATNYKGICELERKIREYPIPPELQFPEDASPNTLFDEEPITQTLQRFIIRLWQNATIMYIHRRFVVQAIRMNSEDPAKSIYAQSVHSAFDSACKHIQDLITLWAAHPRLVARMHPYWTHSFSAAIVLGALVARSPSCGYALDAIRYLEEALFIFREGDGQTVQPSTAVELLNNLHRKALHALNQRESFHESEQQVSEEYVALGALGQVLDPPMNLMNGTPSSPSSLPPNGDETYSSSYGSVNHNNHRGLPASSPTDIYHNGSRYAALTHQNHQNHAAQWIQQQAYFPSRSNVDNSLDVADTPSSNGTGYDIVPGMEGQADWQHGFMQSMGI